MSILFDEFSSICLYLNKIGIVPTLMGSLGLEFISKEDWEPSKEPFINDEENRISITGLYLLYVRVQ